MAPTFGCCQTNRSSTAKLWDCDTLRSVASVNDQLRFGDDASVIRMISDDYDAIALAEFFQFGTFHLQVVLASFSNEREIRVVVADQAPSCCNSSMIVSAGDSRRSSISFLYATPSMSTRDPLSDFL